MSKATALAIGFFVLLPFPAAFADGCPLPGQTQMAIVELFFGQRVGETGTVSRAEWRHFLRDTVTPRFPDGFTVFEAHGQWRQNAGDRIVNEPSKVVEIALAGTTDGWNKIGEVSDIYRRRFHQQSVGVVTMHGCGAF